ncbi:RNase H domain-containing protein [Abeliophyllum distichum]|uniref:RNase H domain-containing protein n=1 Tax=Abeliophyllum distichum TaxID=126358 RepID=A0ABD1RXK3_9LAMI
MKVNLLKCAFGVVSGKFLGYMVNQRKIEANSKNIRALIDDSSPSSPKEVHSLRKRPSIKGQALADFIVEFVHILEGLFEAKQYKVPTQKLYVDESSGVAGARAELLLISPNGHYLNCTLRMEFKASNNTTYYQVLLLSLRLAHEMKAKKSRSSATHSWWSAKSMGFLRSVTVHGGLLEEG